MNRNLLISVLVVLVAAGGFISYRAGQIAAEKEAQAGKSQLQIDAENAASKAAEALEEAASDASKAAEDAAEKASGAISNFVNSVNSNSGN
ncbi:MAG: hypothetical protein OEZ19_00465 [Paracoccaceae bacterium]|nr:hypothetical protein [Paracoccaceae bacterium]